MIPGEVMPLKKEPSRGKTNRVTAQRLANVKRCLKPCNCCGEPMSSSKILKRFDWLTPSTLSRIRSGFYDEKVGILK